MPGIVRGGAKIVNRLKITISKENYLKTIAEAESEGETVIAATLARWLKVSAPAVTMAIRRLKRDQLIRVADEGQITLTRAGRGIANRLLNRHQLIERMLTEIFGMEWYKVHEEAEQLEHVTEAPLRERQRVRLVCEQAVAEARDAQQQPHQRDGANGHRLQLRETCAGALERGRRGAGGGHASVRRAW